MIEVDNGRIVMSPEVADCIAKDAANRRMRSKGRTSWNRSDYNLAVRTKWEFYPLCAAIPEVNPSHCMCPTCQKKVA